MKTIKDDVKQYAKDKGMKMYEVANAMGIMQSTLYHVYLQTTSDEKLKQVKNAIDEYVAATAADDRK